MRHLLVTGASGFLGWNLCRAAVKSWNVTGVYRRNPLALDGMCSIAAELTADDAIGRLLDAVRPDAVVHAAAVAAPNDCEQHPDASYAINVAATVRLARLCAGRGIAFVFISTDLVFDGKHAPCREESPLCPVNTYGRQKAEAEGAVAGCHPGAAICRLPLLFGDPGPYAKTFMQDNLRAFSEGKPQTFFVDEFRTPVGGQAAAEGILMVLEKQIRGILHLGGEERVSRYDFGLLLAEMWGYSSDLVRPARQTDVTMAAARPADVSLDSSRAFALGYSPGSLRRQLQSLSLRP
jgi:dTDP-4-dehydrorhamnose reductase